MAHYWNGTGVYSLGDKDYEKGDEIPGLDKATAARLAKKDLIVSELPRPGRPSGETAQLKAQIVKLKEDNREELELLTAERDELRQNLEDARATIEALTAAKPAEPAGADPKK
jgi:hypothetical protein